MSENHSISRRAFLRHLAAGVIAVAACGFPVNVLAEAHNKRRLRDEKDKSRVVVVTNPAAIRHYAVCASEVDRMLRRGLESLTGEESARNAWRQFVSPTDIVGIKISVAGNPPFSTHLALVTVVTEGLRDAGVAASNIVVWDKSADAMRLAGFPADGPKEAHEPAEQPRCIGTVPHVGYDEEVFYESNLAGRLMWGDHEFGRTEISVRSYYSRLVTRRLTKLICLPVMVDSRDSGLAGSLWTMASGAVDNTRRFEGAPSYFDPAAAEICAHPAIKSKWCLTIADGLLAQYFGGPSFHPQYCWHHASLYLSTDPVAVDTVMLKQIELKRKQVKCPPIGERSQHIRTAAAYKLGQADSDGIETLQIQL